MKTFLCAVAAMLGSFIAFSQKKPPTEAEIQAMMKDLQRKSDSMLKIYKSKTKTDDPNKTIANKTPTGGTVKTKLPGSGANDDFEKIKLPKKDTARIKSIPAKNFSLAELSSYLRDLHTLLEKKLSPGAVSSAKAIADKLGNEPKKLEEAAIIGWQNSNIEESVLLITQAASSPSADGILLTNAGAILDMSGLSEKAVPVLRTIVRIDPENAMAHNNLGQAYTALGMQDSALHYFSRCLSLSPEHPEANNSAGVIEFQKGNTAKAEKHFENSIRGGFNLSAYSGLKHIRKEKCRIAGLIKSKVKYPEYFNQFKFKLPGQCLNVHEAASRKIEKEVFKEMMSKQVSLYRKIGKEAEKKWAAKGPDQLNKSIMEKVNQGKSYLKPFQALASIMEAETIVDYAQEKNELEKFNKENRQQYKDLEVEYKKAYEQIVKKYEADDDEKCCGEGDVSCCDNSKKFCRETNELKNKYLPLFAQLNEEWQSRNLLTENKYFDDLIFWCYFSAYDADDYRNRFYIWVVNYLTTLQRLAEVKILEPCVAEEDKEAEATVPEQLKEFDCPVTLSVPFIVGKIQLDCQSFSFRAGEGVVFRYEKNFVSRQSTISLGVGAELDAFDTKVISTDVKIHMSVFISFDKAGNVSDGGLVSEAKGTLSLGFQGAEKLKFKEGIGWRLGFNSGLGLTPGALKYIIDSGLGPSPEAPQQNRNVRPYNPN